MHFSIKETKNCRKQELIFSNEKSIFAEKKFYKKFSV